jgi:hypothetical protein
VLSCPFRSTLGSLTQHWPGSGHGAVSDASRRCPTHQGGPCRFSTLAGHAKDRPKCAVRQSPSPLVRRQKSRSERITAEVADVRADHSRSRLLASDPLPGLDRSRRPLTAESGEVERRNCDVGPRSTRAVPNVGVTVHRGWRSQTSATTSGRMSWWTREVEVPSDFLPKIIGWVIPGVVIAALVVSHLAKGERWMAVSYLFVGLVWVPLTFLVLRDAAQADDTRSN